MGFVSKLISSHAGSVKTVRFPLAKKNAQNAAKKDGKPTPKIRQKEKTQTLEFTAIGTPDAI